MLTSYPLLPRDLLVEIAMMDWRVYNAIVRADKALNARLRGADRSRVGNYICVIEQGSRWRTHVIDEIARWRRFVIVNSVSGFTQIYRNGVLSWSLVYNADDDAIYFIELERKDSIRYEECVNWRNGELESIVRRRYHPRGYAMCDGYTTYSHSLRFDDYYLTKRTLTRHTGAGEETWRIRDAGFYVYDYQRSYVDDFDNDNTDNIIN